MMINKMERTIWNPSDCERFNIVGKESKPKYEFNALIFDYKLRCWHGVGMYYKGYECLEKNKFINLELDSDDEDDLLRNFLIKSNVNSPTIFCVYTESNKNEFEIKSTTFCGYSIHNHLDSSTRKSIDIKNITQSTFKKIKNCGGCGRLT